MSNRTLSGIFAWALGRFAEVNHHPVSVLGVNSAGKGEVPGVTDAVAASQTLTFAANATSGDTFTIGGLAYRTMTTPAQAYDVQRGGTAAITLDNIKAAVSATGTAGTEYYAGTLQNTQVNATTNTDTTQLFVAQMPGAAGNAIATTSTFTNGGNLFGATTLTGGLNAALKVDATITTTAESTAEATAAAPAYTEGQDAPLSQDLTGRLRTLAETPLATTEPKSTAFEASRVLKASAGQLTSIAIFNSKASAQFILLMNSATVPGDGAVSLLYPPIPISAASLVVIDFRAPLVASTGIAVCNSSTGTFTKTIGSADCAFYAQVN